MFVRWPDSAAMRSGQGSFMAASVGLWPRVDVPRNGDRAQNIINLEDASSAGRARRRRIHEPLEPSAQALWYARRT